MKIIGLASVIMGFFLANPWLLIIGAVLIFLGVIIDLGVDSGPDPW